MKKLLAVFAVAALAGAATIATATNADAQHYRRHHHHHGGGGLAPLVGGLAAGAIIGGAIASSRPAYAYPPGYYAPGYAPGPVDYDEPVCTIQPQQYWDGFSWRVRNVQVCN
jgi:hypothetical protein